MKNIIFKLFIGMFGVILLSQCDILSTIPPIDPPPETSPKSKFESVDYHLMSVTSKEFLVEDSTLQMRELGTKKPKGMHWRIELVENLNEEFYRIKSPYGTYLHIEHGKLEATRLGAPGWHSAMWKIEPIDAANNIYQISNRWKSHIYLQLEPQIIAARLRDRSLRHGIMIQKASEVPVKEKDLVVVNPHLVPIDGDPLKNGHPNIDNSAPVPGSGGVGGVRGADAFIGQIKMFAGNFSPRGWAFCNGQIMEIRDNTALFSLLGTTYGGDGRTTFALPDLRGRAPVHVGKSTNGIQAEYKLGKRYGPAKANIYRDEYQKLDVLKKFMEVSPGVNIPTKRIATQPTMSVHYIIALGGVFPSRN